MVNRPGVIDYLVNEVMSGYIDTMGVDFIYLDETKATNLIDWQKWTWCEMIIGMTSGRACIIWGRKRCGHVRKCSRESVS